MSSRTAFHLLLLHGKCKADRFSDDQKSTIITQMACAFDLTSFKDSTGKTISTFDKQHKKQ